MPRLGFGSRGLATFTPVDQGAQTPGNRRVSADISNIVKTAQIDPVLYMHNMPVIAVGQLQWSSKSHFTVTAQGQGKWDRG